MSLPRLPHGPGFTWIDEVEVDRERASARAKTFLDPSLLVFADHFPGRAIFPGVLLVECGAQAAGCLWSELLGVTHPQPLLLARIQAFRFRRPALPGQTLVVEIRRERAYGRLAEFSVSIYESEEPLAEGRIWLARVDGNGR